LTKILKISFTVVIRWTHRGWTSPNFKIKAIILVCQNLSKYHVEKYFYRYMHIVQM